VARRGPGTISGNWVKHFFFKINSFINEADMERQLADWAGRPQYAHHRAEREGRRPVLLAEERQRLRS